MTGIGKWGQWREGIFNSRLSTYSACSSVWQNACFGSMRSQVRFLLRRPKKIINICLDITFKILYTSSMKSEGIMKTWTEIRKLDAVLRMKRFASKRKGNDKKARSKKLCRKKVVSWE